MGEEPYIYRPGKYHHKTETRFTKEHRERIGASRKKAFAEGRASVKGEKNPRYGCHCDDITKKRIGDGNRGKTGLIGPENPMYGKTPSKEAREASAAKQRGKPKHSDVHKLKLSERLRKFNPMDTPVARKKRSESLKGNLVGNKNPNWRGGSSFLPYCEKFTPEFKERVRAFFDYKCMICGEPQNGRKLSVHHVNYRKDGCCNEATPKLFAAMCNSCHSKTNGGRHYWEGYFTYIINAYYEGNCYLSKEEYEIIRHSSMPTISFYDLHQSDFSDILHTFFQYD